MKLPERTGPLCDLSLAHVLMRKVLTLAEGSGSPVARAAAYWNAALVAEARGDIRAACSFAERSLAPYGEMNNAGATSLLRLICGALLVRDPEPQCERTAALLQQALEELPTVVSPIDVAYAETELARSEILSGSPEGAHVLASSALRRLGPVPRLESVRARVVLGAAQLAAGDTSAALASYTTAAEQLASLASGREAAHVWRELADAMSAMGPADRANEAYRRAVDAAGITGLQQRAQYVATAVAALQPRQ